MSGKSATGSGSKRTRVATEDQAMLQRPSKDIFNVGCDCRDALGLVDRFARSIRCGLVLFALLGRGRSDLEDDEKLLLDGGELPGLRGAREGDSGC